MDQDIAQMAHTLDDIGTLFEFGDIDLNNISSVDPAQYDPHMQHAGTHPSTPFDEISEAQAVAGTTAQDFGGGHQHYAMQHGVDGQQQQQLPPSSQTAQRYNGQGQTSMPFSDQGFPPAMQQDFNANQSFQFGGMQSYPNHGIPPTPNSYEMHGEAGRFLQSQIDPQQRAMLEQRYHLRKEDAIAFTPMVSPAGTPQYSMQPEFTIPGAYFSPLTSPMLHAQTSQTISNPQQRPGHRAGYYTNPSTAPSSNATSPMDPNLDVDMMAEETSLHESSESQPKKPSRRKAAAPRSAGPLARVKDSPIQKAVKRKSGTMLSSLAPRESDGNLDLHRSKSAQPTSTGLHMPRTDSSENGSISPEPLSEALMGPPPRPGSSKNNSPAIIAQQKHAGTRAIGAAATPKSLLSMRHETHSSVSSSNHPASTDQTDFEDLQLPAAAADAAGPHRPSLSQINTQVATSASTEDTPRLAARKTPKLGPLSTPASARPSSAAPSPSVVGSPMTASTPGALLKDRKEPKAGRSSKKRGSVSGSGSALVSPALRPRISPSIKPLLPEGTSLHSPQHALLLASKSNYQNLLEGNHLPGVSYPDSLSTGLTSKRTSHKVAEQGRRNRINEALKEMQALLPRPALSKVKESSNSDESPEVAEGDGKEGKEESVAKSNNSKAATVESANEYIRKLQRENAALLALKKEHDELKKRLEQQQKSVSESASPVSEAAKSVASPAAGTL